jgi:hypothetical protein
MHHEGEPQMVNELQAHMDMDDEDDDMVEDVN